MRLQAAIRGDLHGIIEQELADATVGIQRGLSQASEQLKQRLRGQVKRAGLGERLAKTWQNKDRRGRPLFWRNEGLNAAAMVRTSAPEIISAHMEGATIRAKSGRFLAIPTEHALRVTGARRRRKISPANWPASKGRLRYVRRANGPDLLVLEEARLTKAGRVSVNTRTKAGKLRKGTATLVMFVLVPQVQLKKRLPDVQGVVRRVEAQLPQLILREYRTSPVENR